MYLYQYKIYNWAFRNVLGKIRFHAKILYNLIRHLKFGIRAVCCCPFSDSGLLRAVCTTAQGLMVTEITEAPQLLITVHSSAKP